MLSRSSNSGEIPNPLPPDPLQAALQRFFGYSEFRSPQREIVECLLQSQDALIVLPTGGGKSICYQLPALMRPGVMLVISPLVALMENQVYALRQRRLSAGLLHSELPKEQYRQTLWRLSQQQLRLLYISPETLLSPKVWDTLMQPQIQVQGMVVDEAHCLVQWGDSFRPAYYRLGSVRRSLQATQASPILIAAFTATADPTAQATIARILQLEQPRSVCLSPYRPNLDLGMQTVWTAHQRRQRLRSFIQSQSPAGSGTESPPSGLVYVRTRRDTEDLAAWLAQSGLPTRPYHAGLSPQQRRVVEHKWLSGQLPFVVCTNAFGMGLDLPTVRWIVHFQPPLLLSEYVQEVGRAGRDGQRAEALMLVSEPTGWLDPSDRQRRRFFLDQARQQSHTVKATVRTLSQQGTVTQGQGAGAEAIALALLHQADLLAWSDPFHYTITGRSRLPPLGQSNLHANRQLQRYVRSRDCRWRYLLRAFGFGSEAEGWRCGHCDTCRWAGSRT